MKIPRSLPMMAACVLALTGCALPVHDGQTTHYVVIGIGVVSAHETPAAAMVTNATTLGVCISDRPGLKFALGYASSSVVEVPVDAVDVRIEVRQYPFGAIEVDAVSAELGEDGP